MAIYHLSVKPVCRAGGRSATAAAAYRAAELVYDRTTGQSFDYTRKRGVEHSEIVLPLDAIRRDINWARDRQALWNAAEMAERRSNSRVAREYEIALPHELTRDQRTELVRSFSQSLANRYQCAVDFSIHAPHREGDERNHHAHLLATTRTIEHGGLGAKTTMEWSDSNRQKAGLGPAKQEITAVRALWAELTNERLREQALEIRIDHRSLEAQGITREPTNHLGPAVMEMHRRGLSTEVGRRLEREALEAGQRRLGRAAEMGRLERESQGLERSILDLSMNVQAATRERDRVLAHGTELAQGGQGRAAGRSMDELQREGREAWLALRPEQRVKGVEPSEPEVTRAGPEQPAPTLSLDEQRALAIQAWRKMREGPTPEPERERPRGEELPGPELEGPENEP